MSTETDRLAFRKQQLRRELIAVRRARSPAERAAAAKANAVHLNSALATALSAGSVVCGYLPLPSEPLAVATLDGLTDAGISVLVPLVKLGAPLDWCRYPTPTSAGPFGVAEPDGPLLGPMAAREADVVLLPALAIDRNGHRLGRGGGHYDRTLALIAAGRAAGDQELIAVLFDGELIDRVPTGVYDKAVTAAVTPSLGVIRFRSAGP